LRIARVLSLGAEGYEELGTGFETLARERRQDDLASRARIGGTLEHHELPWPQTLRDRPGRIHDVGEVGLARVGQRRRNADDNRVGLIEPPEVRRCLEPVLSHLADRDLRDVPDIAFPALQAGYFHRIDIESQYRDPSIAKRSRQRQSHVAQTNDPDTH